MPADEFVKWKNEWGKGRGFLQIEVLAMRAAWNAGIESIINAYPKLRATQPADALVLKEACRECKEEFNYDDSACEGCPDK